MNKSLVTGMLILALSISANAAQINFTPYISVTEEYTDNLFLVEDGVEKESDFITKISPGFIFDVLSKQSGISFSYDPTLNYYSTNSEFDYIRQSATGRIYTQATKHLRFELSDTYVETEDPISDDDVTRRENREPYFTNSARALITIQYTPLSSLELGAEHTMLENEDTEVEDTRSLRPFATLTHWITPQWGIILSASHTDLESDPFINEEGDVSDSDDLILIESGIRLTRRYSESYQWFVEYEYNDFNFEEDIDEDYIVHEPAVGLQYSPTRSVTYDALLGYFYQQRSESEDRDGLNAAGAMEITFPRGTLNFEALTGYDTAYSGAERLGFDTYFSIGLGATYLFSQPFTGYTNVSYREDDYEDVSTGRVDKTIGAGTGLSYRVLRWLFFSLNYGYRDFDSEIVEDSYTENRIWATISARPETPFRIAQ